MATFSLLISTGRATFQRGNNDNNKYADSEFDKNKKKSFTKLYRSAVPRTPLHLVKRTINLWITNVESGPMRGPASPTNWQRARRTVQ